MEPLRNDTLQFVETIGNLYFEGDNNLSIAKKRALFFLEFVRSTYYLETRTLDKSFAETLARKSHSEKILVDQLVDQVNYIQNTSSVSDELLIKFSNNLDQFYHFNSNLS